MSNAKTRIARIRYNLEYAGYEAIVFIEELGNVYSYPSFIAAPLDAEYDFVMKRLSQNAQRKHRSGKPGLRSTLRTAPHTPLAADTPPLAA